MALSLIHRRPRSGQGILLCGWLWLATAAAPALGQALVDVPPLRSPVTDLTGTLTADQSSALDAKLRAFEKARGSQVAVLVVPTTRPEEIEQYSIRVVDD